MYTFHWINHIFQETVVLCMSFLNLKKSIVYEDNSLGKCALKLNDFSSTGHILMEITIVI